jgi:predicted amidohydrolase YtcJ
MAADLAVVTDDPLTAVPTALFDLEVVATIVDGAVVFCRAGEEVLCG